MESIPLWQHFVYSAVATMGFSVFFNVPKKILVYEGLVGGVGWITFLICMRNIESIMLVSFIAAASIAILGEILARKLKQPTILFVIPGLLPLVPGIGLYNTVYSIIQKKYTQSLTFGTRAFAITVGLALGILVVSSGSKIFNMFILRRSFLKNDAGKYKNYVNYGKNRTNTKFVIDNKEMNEKLNSMDIYYDNDEQRPDISSVAPFMRMFNSGNIEKFVNETTRNKSDKKNKKHLSGLENEIDKKENSEINVAEKNISSDNDKNIDENKKREN